MKISSLARINFSIIMVCVAAILFAKLTGLIPDDRVFEANKRVQLCESLATNVSYSVGDHDLRKVGKQLEMFASRNKDLLSVGLRRHEGDLVVVVGEHDRKWREVANDRGDGLYVVPIKNSVAEWGQLEIRFTPLYSGVNRVLSQSMLKLLAVVAFLVGVIGWWHLRRVLRYLDPSKSVPPRVREVLNSFAEGVVVLDPDDRIVLVNDSFIRYVETSRDRLLGSDLFDLPWQFLDDDGQSKKRTWHSIDRGTQMRLADDNGQIKTIFSVNASAVLDDNGKNKGVMLAFADVTSLERNRAALLTTLQDLSRSKEEIANQNEELRYLATRDSLTGCVNRRTFFELFEQHWSNSIADSTPLSGIMVDIDFFKSINDSHGHGVGDEVLRQTGDLLKKLTREQDVVCRYGGEEFALLMPGLRVDEAFAAAEQLRLGMEQLEFAKFSVTVSIGVSAFDLGASNPQAMLDQADQCLYVAKRNGRNQVIRFDTVPAELLIADHSRKPQRAPGLNTATIPYSAVSALVSALSFRDHETAAHSMRVSNYAASLAQSVLSPKDVYVVEIAALLHDIGKVGVPDAILLKPGKLTTEEWAIMERHDRVGAEIIKRSFKHQGLTEIVKFHHYRFGGNGTKDQPIQGAELPIGARILTIVDSFDAMTSDRPYRNGMSVTDAIVELKRCAGTQFDPELVDKFVDLVESGCLTINTTSSAEYSGDVMLAIGDQVELLVDAADMGDGETFLAVAGRLQLIAKKHGVGIVSDAASKAIESASDDAQVENLLAETFDLLAACRSMRCGIADSEQNRQVEVTENIAVEKESIAAETSTVEMPSIVGLP